MMKHSIIIFCYSLSLLVLSCKVFAEDNNFEKLSELQDSISNLQRTLQESSKEKNLLENELMSVELEVSQLNRALRQLNKKVSALETEKSAMERRQKILQKGIVAQKGILAQHLRAAHKIGPQDPVKLILNQRDPSKFSRVLSYYNYFTQSRTDKLNKFEQDSIALEETIMAIDQQRVELSKSRRSLAQNYDKLTLGKNQREKTLDKLMQSLQGDQKKLRQWEKQHARLQAILNSVEQISKELTLPEDYLPISSRKGSLSWPVKGRVTKRFGNIRSGSLRWEGWLINTEAGTPVNAVHQGRVVFSNYLRGFGLLIILDHGESFLTLYAHNQELLKNTGDWVEINDTLAHSGNSGGIVKPALYFEIRKSGAPVNPKAWLLQR
tara:strand:- start:2273 stop:3415 length:1143 start_codon:yes stop_codon:yes gene_type:complete